VNSRKSLNGAGALLLCALALVGIAGCTAPTTPKPNATSTSKVPAPVGTMGVEALTPSMCLNSKAGQKYVASVDVVSCSKLHTDEVFRSFELGTSSFPGTAKATSIASQGCATAFVSFAGIPYAKSKLLHYSWYLPTAQTWLAGNHSVVCLIQKTSRSGAVVHVRGTLRDAKE
jgi:hypothetical protein